jgi:hypothetical protein
MLMDVAGKEASEHDTSHVQNSKSEARDKVKPITT